jgi:DNA-binding GntR family transcriptional regulator
MITSRPLERGGHALSVRAQAYSLLRDAIVALRLAPGAKVSDLQLAQELQVSRTPIREALLQLSDERLVDVRPQAGTFVSRISVAAVREAQFVREALEVAALQAAGRRLDEVDLVALEANIAAQRDAAAAGDAERFYELDEALHRGLMQASGFPGAARVADRSRVHLNRVRRLSLPDPEVVEGLVAEHAEIIDSLRRRELDRAEAVLRTHLRKVLETLPALVEQHPDFFLDDTGRSVNGAGALT